MTDVLYVRATRGTRRPESDPLIREAAALFAREAGIDFDPAAKKIERTEKGRPYIADCPFCFSVSHTRGVWACLFTDDGPCGLDVQRADGRDHRRSARRFFRPEEDALAEMRAEGGAGGSAADGRGRDAADPFYRIWTMREAFVKMTGEGFFSPYPDLRASSGVFRGTPYWFTAPSLGEGLGSGLAACVCLTHPGEAAVRRF